MSQIAELAPIILEEIKKAKHILLSCHTGPDGDSVGSTLAMHEYLKSLSKQVTHISGDSKVPGYLSKLPGADEIQNKTIFDIDLSKIDLYLIIDTGGINQITKLKEFELPENLMTVVIDHHASNLGFGKINLVEKDVIAASQIVYELLKAWNVEISTEMALNLFIGIYTDSGGFKYNLTSPKTFEAASELVRINPEYWRMIFIMENSREEGEIRYEGLALSKIEKYFSGKVAVSVVTLSDLKKHQLDQKYARTGDLANKIKSVVGFEIGICLAEKEKGVFGLSFRTRDSDKYNLSVVSSKLNGGGHKAAAGGLLKGSLKNAREELLEALKKSYPTLGKA